MGEPWEDKSLATRRPDEVGEEGLDAGVDLITDAAHHLDRLAGGVLEQLGHGRDHGGVEPFRGVGAGRTDLHPAVGVVVEEGGGHLAAAGVVDAHEQDLGVSVTVAP
jgi:hypothetical protein